MRAPIRHLMIGVALAAVALAAASCGDRRLLLSVDVLSFLAPSETQTSVGPIPAIPGGAYSGEQPLVDDEKISLFSGANGAVDVRDVIITVRTVATGQSGSGTDTLRVYLSGPSQPPRPGTPLLTSVLTFAAGMADTQEVVLQGSKAVADLFTGEQVRLSLTTALRGPAAGADLTGDLKLIRLDALVIAGRNAP